MLGDFQPAAAAIGLASIGILVLWDRSERLKKTNIPSQLVVVLLGVAANLVLEQLGSAWAIEPTHLVQVPVSNGAAGLLDSLQHPDFTQWSNPAVYMAAVTLAVVASLEALLNLEAVDRIDPQQRNSPPNRELVAQGFGNIVSGLIGGLPVTTVIVRSSVNINAGARTRLSAITHGVLLATSVVFLPHWLNRIPLACLAAILLVTGVKLASPALIRQMWHAGRYQFIPFAATLVAIVFTDLLSGILIGMGVSVGFILHSNMRRPVRRFVEKHLGGDVLHVVLANQVSFLNRAALVKVLDNVPKGGQVLLDARSTDYIDPDLLDLIRDFTLQTGPARGVEVSLLGFRDHYQLQDQIQYVDYSTRDLQQALTPAQVLQILKEGHERFKKGQHLTRDLGRQINATANGQHPLAVVLSCIDSRIPIELIFDLGLGDIFSIRIAGNVTSPKVIGSVEYACGVAGAKLVVVMGHTRCGAVTAAVDLLCSSKKAVDVTGCQHLDAIIREIEYSIDPLTCRRIATLPQSEKDEFLNTVSRRNMLRTVSLLLKQSRTLHRLVQDGRIAVIGSMYDVTTGDLEFVTRAEAKPVVASEVV